MTDSKMDQADKRAQALRANLRKRKEQARTRAQQAGEESASRACSKDSPET